jgi:hypothetical protein
LGYILGEFFRNSSGHPESHLIECTAGRILNTIENFFQVVCSGIKTFLRRLRSYHSSQMVHMFAYQICQYEFILEGLGMENFGIHIVWSFGIFSAILVNLMAN